MATGYTSILKLALPVTGELAGTWGTVVNDNITQMIEQAVAGLATINTWTTNSHTLTVANGTSSESRCAMLVASDGAGLSAAGEIICPAATKLYVLKNGTSYQITLKTASGTGVAVPTGQTAFLFCDGTNVLSCGGVTSVTGTSPVASSGGATPAISLSANYGDTLNPYASKTANFVLAAPNGSAGVPTFRALVAADVPTLNQNTTGTAANVTGTVAIANGGTGQTTANAAFNALVPSQTSNSGKYLTTDGTNTSWATVSGGTPAGSNTQVQYNNSGAFGASASFTFSTNHLFVNNVKIGRGSGTNTTLSTAVGTSTLNSVTTGSAHTMVGYGAGSALQTGQENTGIGWGACGGPVSTDNNTAVGSQTLASATGANNTMVGARCGSGAMTGSDNTGLGSGAFSNSPVTGSNNIAIGAGGVLQGLTTGANNTFVGVSAGNTFASGSNTAAFGYNAQPSTTSVSNEITLGNSSITTLRCQVTSITALSDARDKKDVQNIPLGVDFIQRLRPVSFVWNTRDGAKVNMPEFGFIAQELQSAQRDHGVTLPGLVHDINPDRLEAAPGTLIPVLVKAVQELQAQIDSLKQQLAARG